MRIDQGEKRRVLLIMGSSGVGGFETISAQVLEEMDKEKLAFFVFFMDGQGGILPRFRPHCEEVFVSGSGSFFKKIRELILFGKKVNPQTVFAGGYKANLAFRITRLFSPTLKQARYVFQLMSVFSSMTPNPFKTWLEKKGFGSVEFILSNSQAGLDHLKELGYPKKPSVVAINGLDTEKFQPDCSKKEWLRSELGLPAESIVFICVANIKPVKNHSFLLEAFQQIAGANKNAVLILAGAVEEGSPIPTLIKERKLEKRVLLLGPRNDVPNLLKGSDIFVLASHWEGISGSIQEAMACGLPVISTLAGGGVAEIVENEKSGFLVKNNDLDGFTKAMTLLAGDPSLRQKMGENGRQFAVKNFSMKEMAKKWEAAIGL